MEKSFSPYEQALVAFISEAKISGQNIEEIAGKAKEGIRGNKPYTWVGADFKSAVIDALDQAVKDVK